MSRDRYIHGLCVTLADADGEVLDYDVADGDELRDHFADETVDLLESDALAAYALDRFERDGSLANAVDWRLEPLASRYGVSDGDFLYPRN